MLDHDSQSSDDADNYVININVEIYNYWRDLVIIWHCCTSVKDYKTVWVMNSFSSEELFLFWVDHQDVAVYNLSGICWWYIYPIACSPVRDSSSKDYRQHCPGHLPSTVHVCSNWSPIVQGRQQITNQCFIDKCTFG